MVSGITGLLSSFQAAVPRPVRGSVVAALVRRPPSSHSAVLPAPQPSSRLPETGLDLVLPLPLPLPLPGLEAEAYLCLFVQVPPTFFAGSAPPPAGAPAL